MDILILLGLIVLSAVISTAEIGFFAVNATNPISAVDITAERTIRPKRMRISMDCAVLETTGYAGQPEIPETPGAVPHRLDPAM